MVGVVTANVNTTDEGGDADNSLNSGDESGNEEVTVQDMAEVCVKGRKDTFTCHLSFSVLSFLISYA